MNATDCAPVDKLNSDHKTLEDQMSSCLLHSPFGVSNSAYIHASRPGIPVCVAGKSRQINSKNEWQ